MDASCEYLRNGCIAAVSRLISHIYNYPNGLDSVSVATRVRAMIDVTNQSLHVIDERCHDGQYTYAARVPDRLIAACCMIYSREYVPRCILKVLAVRALEHDLAVLTKQNFLHDRSPPSIILSGLLGGLVYRDLVAVIVQNTAAE